MSDFTKGLWPRGLSAWFALILAVMSVLKLGESAVNLGLGPTLSLCLDYYDRLVNAFFGQWAEPIVTAWLDALRTWAGWELHLAPHWKHVFILTNVYFVRNAWGSFAAGLFGTGLFRLSLGLVTALTLSVVTGVFGAQHEIWPNFLLVFGAIVGVSLYDFLCGTWDGVVLAERTARIRHRETLADASTYVWAKGFYALRRTIVGSAIALMSLQFSVVQNLPDPALAIMAFLILLRAVYDLLWVGARQAGSIQNEGESWLAAYRRAGSAKIGWAVLRVFLWGALFVAANAGLSSYGL